MHMNENSRVRRQTLLVVEGKHEKNILFWLLFKCFPELSIMADDVWVYGTNIYMLYDDIEKEYGREWYQEEIDLPFVISQKKCLEKHYKEDFINIILVFDYERHDPAFSESKILCMQEYFQDAADQGKLYINYPMIESYQHIQRIPDEDYMNRKIPVTLQPGHKYKNLVNEDSKISEWIQFPHQLNKVLQNRWKISEDRKRDEIVKEILDVSDMQRMDDTLHEIFQNSGIQGSDLQTVIHQTLEWVRKGGYVGTGNSYWKNMREIFCYIILLNICKAGQIQTGQNQIRDSGYKTCFEQMDDMEILRKQNAASKDAVNGFIWVLSTCVCFVAGYKFFWEKENIEFLENMKFSL